MPHSRGSAAYAQTLVDERAGNPKNIENIKEDLRNREHCSFIAMLKALMLRQLMMQDNDRNSFTPTEEEWKAVDEKFKTLLDDSVGFVNGEDGNEMIMALKKYCDVKTETTRYPYFVAVLNEILHHFRKPKNTINDGDIIFAINDPAIIESHNLPTPTKRKPDIICLLAARFKSMFDSENLLFPALMNSAKTRRKSMDLTWGDILQSWELGTSGNKITSKIRRNFKAQEFLDRDEESRINEPAGPSTSQASAIGGVKRKRTSESILPSKKAKTDDPLPPLISKLPKIVQCAYYGIERLRHSIDITHTMNVLLIDATLTLYWYDSQGCIESDTIDIIKSLPFLVIMIRIFYDFPLGMWGHTPIDIWTEDEIEGKVHYSRKGDTIGSFQMKGRRTFTSDAIPVTAPTAISSGHHNEPAQPSSSHDEHSEGTQLEVLFLKSAWPEVKRHKEPYIISHAYTQAKMMLGTEAGSVTDHLPVVINSKELSYTSTEIIRRLVKSTSTDGFRVQLWMLSKKLQPIYALDSREFWIAFWHTLRCHALLWRIGIAHGDISLWNLMYKTNNKYGVLNDFDLSSIMEPGDESPNRQGLERTGTLPFMAMQLLIDEGFDGKVSRRYDHELESFSWVLVWVSRCVNGGKEIQAPQRLLLWLNNNNETVYMAKLTFIRKKKTISTTSDYKSLGKIADDWVDIWDSRDQLDNLPALTIAEHLRALLAISSDVPIDVSWVDGLSELKFIPPVILDTQA